MWCLSLIFTYVNMKNTLINLSQSNQTNFNLKDAKKIILEEVQIETKAYLEAIKNRLAKAKKKQSASNSGHL